MTFTVMIANSMLNRTHYQGTFATLDEANAFAQQQAARSRTFCTFAVYKGTPRNPIVAVDGTEIKGAC